MFYLNAIKVVSDGDTRTSLAWNEVVIRGTGGGRGGNMVKESLMQFLTYLKKLIWNGCNRRDRLSMFKMDRNNRFVRLRSYRTF